MPGQVVVFAVVLCVATLSFGGGCGSQPDVGASIARSETGARCPHVCRLFSDPEESEECWEYAALLDPPQPSAAFRRVGTVLIAAINYASVGATVGEGTRECFWEEASKLVRSLSFAPECDYRDLGMALRGAEGIDRHGAADAATLLLQRVFEDCPTHVEGRGAALLLAMRTSTAWPRAKGILERISRSGFPESAFARCVLRTGVREPGPHPSSRAPLGLRMAEDSPCFTFVGAETEFWCREGDVALRHDGCTVRLSPR